MKKNGGVIFDGKNTDNWVGTSGSNGTCVVSYDKDKGVIFTWSGGSGTQRPKYKESPFYSIEEWNANENDQKQGFAYYTYGDGGSIKEFTYVNKDKVYRTTDGGKTWYDITP